MTTKREVRPDQHGTPTGYTYGCRCEDCKAAARVASRRSAQAPVASHGTGGYRRGCRCEQCVDMKYASNGASVACRDWAEGTAALDEVRQWGIGLGLPLAIKGKVPQPLIDRWNREHPERPYVGKKAATDRGR